MANRFYTNVETLLQGTNARAEAVEAKCDEVEGGFLNVSNEMNRSIRFMDGNPAEADFQVNFSAAQRAQKILGFNASGNVDLLSNAFNWRGNWAPFTAYAVNDMVRAPEAQSFSLYVVTASHVSAAAITTDIGATRLSIAVDLSEMQRFIRKFQIITANYTAVAGDDLFVDVSAGALTITLPAAPLLTDQPITICHAAGNIGINNITVLRNGKPIMGLNEDMIISTTNASLELAYMNSVAGWRLVKGT